MNTTTQVVLTWEAVGTDTIRCHIHGHGTLLMPCDRADRLHSWLLSNCETCTPVYNLDLNQDGQLQRVMFDRQEPLGVAVFTYPLYREIDVIQHQELDTNAFGLLLAIGACLGLAKAA